MRIDVYGGGPVNIDYAVLEVSIKQKRPRPSIIQLSTLHFDLELKSR